MTTKSRTTTIALSHDKGLSLFEKFALVIASSGLLILSAKLMLPIFSIHMTFQPFAVIALGIFLGPRLAVAATMAYILEGAAGLPVYADSLSYPGLSFLMKPSAGFIISFPIAAYVAGFLAEKGWTSSLMKTTALFTASYIVMYVLGSVYLASFIGLGLTMKTIAALIPADMAKIGLGATATRLFSKN